MAYYNKAKTQTEQLLGNFAVILYLSVWKHPVTLQPYGCSIFLSDT